MHLAAELVESLEFPAQSGLLDSCVPDEFLSSCDLESRVASLAPGELEIDECGRVEIDWIVEPAGGVRGFRFLVRPSEFAAVACMLTAQRMDRSFRVDVEERMNWGTTLTTTIRSSKDDCIYQVQASQPKTSTVCSGMYSVACRRLHVVYGAIPECAGTRPETWH